MSTFTSKGFSLLEFLVVLGIITILSTFAIPAWDRFMEINRFNKDVIATEYGINKARITAMARTTNVGVCTGNRQILVYDTGFERGNNPCRGTLLFTITLSGLSTTLTGSGTIIFDPRGLTTTWEGGSVCLRNAKLNNYYKITVERGTQRVEKGEGQCL